MANPIELISVYFCPFKLKINIVAIGIVNYLNIFFCYAFTN